MALDSDYDLLWKRQHRFGISLTLLVYSVCYLICDYFFINNQSLELKINLDNFYILSLLLIAISSLLLIIFDTILNKTNTVLRITISTLLIIGGLLYFTQTTIQSLQRHQNNAENALLYTLLYSSCALFITANALTLGIINLLDCYFCKTILLINSIIFIITCTGMIYFWSIYYTYSSISPTQTQIGLIQAGWIIIATVSASTVIYEKMNSKHIPFLRILSVLLIIGGCLVFAGSCAFSADIIFFNSNFDYNNIEIVIEWSLSFCVFIACITFSLLVMKSTKEKHFTHLSLMDQSRNNFDVQNEYKYPIDGFNMSGFNISGFDLMLETEPNNNKIQWADV